MLDGLIMAVAGLLAALLGFRVLGAVPGESRAWDRWHDRFGKLLKTVGPLLVVIGLALAGWELYGDRLPGQPTAPPAPPTLQVDGTTISSEPVGFTLPLSEWWEFGPPGPGADFSAKNLDSGAALIGTALETAPPGTTSKIVVTKIVEGRQRLWGSVSDLAEGETKIGGMDAYWAIFAPPQEDATRTLKLTVTQKGPYTLSFTCLGPPAALDGCDAALSRASFADSEER